MPYMIDKNTSGEFCVFKQDADGNPTGDTLGCHETQDGAKQQLSALYAAESRNGQNKTAIKALNDEGLVGGYLVAFGSPDQRDLHGEYFTSKTNFALDLYEQRPALYHHGLDGTVRAERAGVIKSLKVDDWGVWAEAQLDMHKEYVQAVLQLVKKGVLGWSSGSLPHLVEVTDSGEIKAWPIIEGSLTPSPAEPRRTEISVIKSAYKELGLDLGPLIEEVSETEPASDPEDTQPVESAIVETQPEDAEEPQAREQGAGADTDAGVQEISHEEQQPIQETDMNPQEIVMAALDAFLTHFQADLSPEDKTALVQSVVAQLGQQDQSAQMDAARAAEVAQEAAPLVAKAVDAFIENRKKTQQAAKASAEAAVANLLANVQPESRVNGHKADEPKPDNIQVFSRTHDWTASDMAFFYQWKQKAGGAMPSWFDGQKFFREVADKATKAADQGRLTLDQKAIKAINAIKANELDHSTQTSYGDEWVPDLWSSELWRTARVDNVVLPLFRTVEMPSNPFELPIEGTDPTAYFVPETTAENQQTLSGANNAMPDSKIGSGKVTLTAKKLAIRVGFSAELEEDSIIPIIPMYREQAQRTLADAVDHVLVNGDDTNAATGNINSDDGDPADTEKYLAMNGLLHSALVEDTTRAVDASGVAPTLSLIRQTRFAMAAANALRPQDIAVIVGAEVYAKLLGLNEFLTMDKIGNQATILNGMIGQIDGSPVLASAELALAEADGKISTTASNNTLGRLLMVYRPNWYVGYRRRASLDVSYLPFYDSYQLTATIRFALAHRDDDSASVLYDLSV